MGSILCEHCAGACCRYLALPLDKPTSRRDYDDIRWYLMHEGVTVFVEDGDWYIQHQTRCKNLGADNRCTIYTTRPEICREYEPDACDYEGGDFQFFQDPDPVSIPRTRGCGVIYPAYMVHRVAPVISGTLLSLTAWVIGPPLR